MINWCSGRLRSTDRSRVAHCLFYATASADLTIAGPGAANLMIDGDQFNYPVITIAGGHTVSINNVTIQNGGLGGIYNSGTLTLSNSILTNNNSNFYGGGIANQSTLTVNNTLFNANGAGNQGGAIYNNAGATLNTVRSPSTTRTTTVMRSPTSVI
jgi:predicted outer membrane repeat protein